MADDAPARYDTIGTTYARTRRADPRIAAEIERALGPASSVLNVGAGTGNYEPTGRVVVAVEPSAEMIRQRPTQARVVRAVAETLPFREHAFEVAMALLTTQHWNDPVAGLDEMRRVSMRQVVWYCEPLNAETFWPMRYFPEASKLPSVTAAPGEAMLREHLDVLEIRPLFIPPDCSDGFGAAFWARPEAYLDPVVQAGMSWLALLEPAERLAGVRRLTADLANGRWDREFGQLRAQHDFDGGLRIAIAG